MAGTTIAATTTIALDLVSAGQVPVSITATGTIRATGLSGQGVRSLGSATIRSGGTNCPAAVISGYEVGVAAFDAASQVINLGTIRATAIRQSNASSGLGVHLLAGGLNLDYDPATGLLQVAGSGGSATLRFENSALGPGSFHVTGDGGGHALITHG